MKIRESGTSPWQWQQRPSPAQPAVVVGPETFLQQQQRNPSAQVLLLLKELSSGPTIFTKKLPSDHLWGLFDLFVLHGNSRMNTNMFTR